MFLTDEDYKAVCDDFEFEQLQAHTDIPSRPNWPPWKK